MFRNRIIAFLISLGVHILAFLGIYFLTLHSEKIIKSKEITLVPVGVLKEQPKRGGMKKAIVKTPTPPPAESKKENISKQQPAPKLVHTERKEATLPTPNTVKEKPKESEEEIQKRKAKEAAEAERKKREKIKNLAKGAFSKGSKQTNNKRSESEGIPTDQGEDIQAGFSLAGRSISGNGGFPARPRGFKPIRGTVVVNILVNDKGVVIKADRRLKGTNITDPQTIRAAIRAAKETHFNSSLGANDQKGTITYHFDVQ